jgi:tRNA-2-methylthio-N6-dimethylallyladenosine synthase
MINTFFIQTMGCQMNEYDSDYVAQSLINSGVLPVDSPAEADLILINTCTVRAKPDQKAYSLLGRLAPLKQNHPNIILGVMGCLAQKKGGFLIDRFPYLDMVIGPREIGKLRAYLDKIQIDRRKIVATALHNQSAPPLIFSHGYFNQRVTGYISIMQGCNNFCAYCVVPYVRGREICRPFNEIFEEVKNLISEGIKDITLLGQNVNSYRRDRGEVNDFTSLLKKLGNLKELSRVRFTTSHPKDLSDDLIRCFGEIDNLCPHIHLPFQAGSNQVLERMRRGYTREKYIELIGKLRAARSDIAITSDVMAGFPGESESDFEMTLDLIEQIKFDSLFSFMYSDREGTISDKMHPKVDQKEKASRLSIIQGIQKKITLEKNRRLEGQDLEVLVEGYSKQGEQLTGKTGANKTVNFYSDKSKTGDLVKVKIKCAFINSLLGKEVS